MYTIGPTRYLVLIMVPRNININTIIAVHEKRNEKKKTTEKTNSARFRFSEFRTTCDDILFFHVLVLVRFASSVAEERKPRAREQ